jgi:hypothetical protein
MEDAMEEEVCELVIGIGAGLDESRSSMKGPIDYFYVCWILLSTYISKITFYHHFYLPTFHPHIPPPRAIKSASVMRRDHIFRMNQKLFLPRVVIGVLTFLMKRVRTRAFKSFLDIYKEGFQEIPNSITCTGRRLKSGCWRS